MLPPYSLSEWMKLLLQATNLMVASNYLQRPPSSVFLSRALILKFWVLEKRSEQGTRNPRWAHHPIKLLTSTRAAMTRVFLFKFLRYVDWQLSRRGVSQIWLQIREKSSNFLKPGYILATYKNLCPYMTHSNFFPQNMTTYGLFSLENPLDRSQPPLCLVTKWQKIATKKRDKINLAESLARQHIFDLPWCSTWYTYTTHRLCWPLCDEAPIAHFQTAKCVFIFRVCCKVDVQLNDAQLGFTFNNTNFHQVLVDNL
jgi:hypothetical protein